MNGKDLVELRKTLERGDRLSDAQVVELAKLRREASEKISHVRVGKLALREGEELMDFVWTMVDAVQTNRIILADGSLDAWLQGIFEDHVIVMDGNTGKFFKANFSRDASGEIVFEEPVEVRMLWVPVGEGAGDETEKAIAKRAPEVEQILQLEKTAGSRWSFLPSSLRGR